MKRNNKSTSKQVKLNSKKIWNEKRKGEVEILEKQLIRNILKRDKILNKQHFLGKTNNQNKPKKKKRKKKDGAYLEIRRWKDEHDDEDNHVKIFDEAWQWIYQKYI